MQDRHMQYFRNLAQNDLLTNVWKYCLLFSSHTVVRNIRLLKRSARKQLLYNKQVLPWFWKLSLIERLEIKTIQRINYWKMESTDNVKE